MAMCTTSRGEVIHFKSRGEGPCLLLISGWGGDAASWEAELAFFGARMRCLTIEHPGFQGIPAPSGSFGTAEMADRIARGLEALGISRAAVLGMSMGGSVAQELALRHPHLVEALILSATFAKLDDRAAKGIALSTDLLDTCDRRAALRMIYWLVFGATFYGQHHSTLDALLAERLKTPIPQEIFQYQCQACLEHDTTRRLHQISCPTCITHGAEDILVSLPHAKKMAAAVPYSTLRVFPAGGHCHLWEMPQDYRQTVLDFLGSNGGASR